jgi:hypothetical protein
MYQAELYFTRHLIEDDKQRGWLVLPLPKSCPLPRRK